MNESLFPPMSRELAEERQALANDNMIAWRDFSRQIFKQGALDIKTKQLIAVAVAHVTQCPYCIRSHTAQALKAGATSPEIMEAIWISAEMRAGAVVAHSTIALDVIKSEQDDAKQK